MLANFIQELDRSLEGSRRLCLIAYSLVGHFFLKGRNMYCQWQPMPNGIFKMINVTIKNWLPLAIINILYKILKHLCHWCHLEAVLSLEFLNGDFMLFCSLILWWQNATVAKTCRAQVNRG